MFGDMDGCLSLFAKQGILKTVLTVRMPMTSQDSQTQEDNSPTEENSANPTKSGWYDDPGGSGGLRWYNSETDEWGPVSEAANVNFSSKEVQTDVASVNTIDTSNRGGLLRNRGRV